MQYYNSKEEEDDRGRSTNRRLFNSGKAIIACNNLDKNRQMNKMNI